MDRVDAIVVGAGVVGLAVAREFAGAGLEPLILEGAARIGTGVSARSSEVIHAGLYYPPGSLKARLCVRGRELLYRFCASRGVAHRRLGKLVVAADAAQAPALDGIEQTARAAGVDDLRRVDADELRRLEPALAGEQALLSPSSGIVVSQGLMLALLGEAEGAGGVLSCGSRVTRVTREAGAWRVHVAQERGPDAVIETRWLVNAAGLGAQALARRIDALDPAGVPALHLARGHYFEYAGAVPFSRLVYPVPVPGGLGTHLTLDLAGRARFGPDVEWVEREDYSPDPGRLQAFAAAARRLWPEVDPTRLRPAYVGIRPKLGGPGAPAADFVIAGPAEHGLGGLVNLFGIESPGLTASLAIAEEVARRLRAA